MDYKEYKLRKGEWISKVDGRMDDKVDKLIFYTNHGRKFDVGGDGGSAERIDDVYAGMPYIFAFNLKMKEHLTGITVFYVNMEHSDKDLLPKQ